MSRYDDYMRVYASLEGLSDIELLTRVVDDISNLIELAQSDPRAALRASDGFSQLPHPGGRGGFLLASMITSAAFEILARHALKRRGLERRVELNPTRKLLQNEFVKRFVVQNRPVDQRQTDRLLSWAAKQMEPTTGPRTYLIPVRFTFGSEPDVIDLGPVELMPTRRAIFELFSAARSYLRGHPSGKDRDWARIHIRKALDYYRSYKWVARVTIPSCDEGTAEELARETALSALDCLHLLLGRRASDRLRIGDEKVSHSERATLSIDEAGELKVATSVGSLDVMGLADGWAASLDRPDVVEMLALFRLALDAKSDPRLVRPLADRFRGRCTLVWGSRARQIALL